MNESGKTRTSQVSNVPTFSITCGCRWETGERYLKALAYEEYLKHVDEKH